MKHIFGGLLLLALAVGCTNNGETENYNSSSKGDSLKEAPKMNTSGYSAGFQKLVNGSEGMFRNVSLGMTSSEVKNIEKDLKPEEETPEYISYMIDFGELEEAEISYWLDKGKRVGAIEVNIYPKSKGSQDTLFMEFEKYLTGRYGSPSQPDSNSRKWEYKNQDLAVSLSKKGTQKVHDLNLRFSYLTREMASVPY